MVSGNTAIQAITPKDLLIYLCLRRYRNPNTGEATISIAKISNLTKASPVTILSSLDRLSKLKHIKIRKQGRQNYYLLLSDIEASDYNFLDDDSQHSDKVKKAVEMAYIPQNGDNYPGSYGDRVYAYIESLEESICLLQRQMDILATEADNMKKCLSVITGQTYTPIGLPT